jgi:hypothetical protein
MVLANESSPSTGEPVTFALGDLHLQEEHPLDDGPEQNPRHQDTGEVLTSGWDDDDVDPFSGPSDAPSLDHQHSSKVITELLSSPPCF